MSDMLLRLVTAQRDYWVDMLVIADGGIIAHIEDRGSPAFHEAKLAASFCREMLGVCERWLEQISPEDINSDTEVGDDC